MNSALLAPLRGLFRKCVPAQLRDKIFRWRLFLARHSRLLCKLFGYTLDERKVIYVTKHFNGPGIQTEFLTPLFGADAKGGQGDKLLQYLRQHLHSGGVAFDIGAHVGFYSMIMSKIVGETGRVISCEPSSNTYGVLQHNIDRNRLTNITALRVAVVGKDKTDIYLRQHSEKTEFNKIVATPSQAHERVTATDLQTLFSENGVSTVDFMKMDIQGSEDYAVPYAQELFRDNKITFFYLETHAGVDCERIITMLEGYGYQSVYKRKTPLEGRDYFDILVFKLRR